jgi:hypothetical protein
MSALAVELGVGYDQPNCSRLPGQVDDRTQRRRSVGRPGVGSNGFVGMKTEGANWLKFWVAPTGLEPAPRGVGILCRLFVFVHRCS